MNTRQKSLNKERFHAKRKSIPDKPPEPGLIGDTLAIISRYPIPPAIPTKDKP